MTIESGWVIEGAWSSTATPDYWVGSSAWSSDSEKALRFARQKDAQQAADLMCAGLNVRICLHEWARDDAPLDMVPAPDGSRVLRIADSTPAVLVTHGEHFGQTINPDSAPAAPSKSVQKRLAVQRGDAETADKVQP